MDRLARLREQPQGAAIILDVDGVLAPIVARPEDAHVPPETKAELRRLHARYALVACVSGRAGVAARAIVGVEELVYVGNHGLELDDSADPWRDRLRALLADVAWPDTEDKELSAALHYRDAADEQKARAKLERVAVRAKEAGFVTRFGRKVLEILPPVDANKGTAVRRLLGERGLKRALYAGDDTTDLDAFAVVGKLDVGVRVAVASDDGPSALREQADITVSSPAEMLALLRRL